MSILWWVVGLFIVGAVAYSLISREAIDEGDRNNDGLVIINDEEFSEELGYGDQDRDDLKGKTDEDMENVVSVQENVVKKDEESSEELSGYGNGDFRYRQYTGGYGIDPKHEGLREDNAVSQDNEVSVSENELLLKDEEESEETSTVISNNASLADNEVLKDEAIYGAKELYNKQSDEEYGRDSSLTDDVHGYVSSDYDDEEFSKNVDFTDSKFPHDSRGFKRTRIEEDDDDDLPMSSRTRMEEETYMNRHDVCRETNSSRKNRRK